jgi:hypothetical protein
MPAKASPLFGFSHTRNPHRAIQSDLSNKDNFFETNKWMNPYSPIDASPRTYIPQGGRDEFPAPLLVKKAHFLYLAVMRSEYLLIAALLLTACGGRKITANSAADAITGTHGELFAKKDVEVVVVRQTSGSAIVETKLNAAFRLEKVQNKLVVQEVRLGHGRWQKISDFERALEMVQIEETRKILDRIAEAILKYRENKGSLPVFKDYVSLSDILSPMYLDPLIRLDAWNRPLEAFPRDSKGILLRSAGPDGKCNTNDDISKTVIP